MYRSRLQYNIMVGGSIAWGDGGRARGATEHYVYTAERKWQINDNCFR
jgi:hypothetical protein